MKRLALALLVLLPVLLFTGCGPASDAVEDPPTFVEMYLDPAADVLSDREATRLPSLQLLEEELTTTAALEEYDGSFYTETDFEVVVITTGANYDLLFSVELTDSLLGTCVYTDQSALYVASSTVEVEADQSYTTTIRLTIPGSTDPDAYLSERTIALSKILFSRDTVDGTFPADIPSNTTTSLRFEIHAREYFDTTIGLPLRVNEAGSLDVFLTPASPYYDDAVALGLTAVVLPETVNGYPIGSIFLSDLYWVEAMSLAGASDDVFLIGDFSALAELVLTNFSFPVVLEQPKDLTITGSFPVLTNIALHAIDRFDFFLGKNPYTDDESYEAWIGDAGDPLYDFPLLSSLAIDAYSRMGTVRIGKDSLGLPFPALASILVEDAFIDNLEIGEEANGFAALTEIAVSDTELGSLRIAGSQPPANAACSLILIGVAVSHAVEIEGSLVGTVQLAETEVGSMTIEGGTIGASKLAAITFDQSTFGGEGTRLFSITGSHPALTALDLAGFSLNNLQIGGIGSVFAALASIRLTDITAYNLYVGDRDASFPVLEDLVIQTSDVTAALRLGGEFVLFPALVNIYLDDVAAGSLMIAGTDFDAVETVILQQCDFTGSIGILADDTFAALDYVYLDAVTCLSLSIYISTADYLLYAFGLTATNGLSLSAVQCVQIHVTETDPTAWPYYAYADGLGIPVTHAEPLVLPVL